ncbi:MAG: phytanoyl-CoA dioxygenase family protein [Kiloniellaceae bacterium]
MTPEEICRETPRLLSAEDRQRYFDEGGIAVPGVVGPDWLARCRAAVERLKEESARLTQSTAVFDLEPGHSADNPRLRRISSPCDQDPVFWELLTEGPLGDLAMDLLGPDVKFYQAKLNFKSPKGGTEVRWHQDAPFFPHTNHAVLTMGVYLDDCSLEHGPLEIIPGSHKGEIFDHYDEAGEWRGEIRQADCGSFDPATARVFDGAAGAVTVHNYRTVHGSKPNVSQGPRPLLLYVLSAADALPYTAQPLKSRYEQAVVRGQAATHAHHEPGRFRLPPDWSGGYSSIFVLQQQEAAAAAM